jgi:hypothetical protein
MPDPTQRLLANLRELAPGITARAAEIGAGRRTPPDLVETLRSIGDECLLFLLRWPFL